MLNEQTIVKWDKNAETDLRNGLTKAQVKERQTIYGPNRLREGKKKSVLKLFWEQLNDPLIYILMAAIAISLFLGEAGESMIIAAVIILNAVVGVIQEGKAIKAIEALQQLSSPKALVKRDGREMEIPGRLADWLWRTFCSEILIRVESCPLLFIKIRTSCRILKITV